MQPPHPDIEHTIPLPTGVVLRAVLSHPVLSSTKLAVLVHPWSWLGGSMHEPTIVRLATLLLQRGYHVLRYNSRGVGKSSGWPSLSGIPEGEDLKAVVHKLLADSPHIDSLTIIGYSYGSLIASLHPVLDTPVKTSHLLLSYPLSPRWLITTFHTDTYVSALHSILRNPDARLLLIYSDMDQFTSDSKYQAWVDGLRRTDGSQAQFDVVRVEGAGHFWATRDAAAELVHVVGRWLS